MKLTYFPVRGRAEPCLLMLIDSGIDFEQEIITSKEWAEMKKEGCSGPPRFPFGALPTLTFGHGARGGADTILSETSAILLFLEGKLAAPGTPTSPPDARARLEMIRSASSHLMTRLFFIHSNTPDWLSPSKRKPILDEHIVPFLDSLSVHLSNEFYPPLLTEWHSAPRGTTTLSAAAATSCSALELVSEMFPKELGLETMSRKWPKCAELVKRVLGRPRIKEWLEQGGREIDWTRSDWGTKAWMDEAARVAAMEEGDDVILGQEATVAPVRARAREAHTETGGP